MSSSCTLFTAQSCSAFILISHHEVKFHVDCNLCIEGPGASEQKCTRSSFSTNPQRCSTPGKRWSVTVLNRSVSSVTLSVMCPSDACIGLYSLSVRSGSCSIRCERAITVLFNPWCEGASVRTSPEMFQILILKAPLICIQF